MLTLYLVTKLPEMIPEVFCLLRSPCLVALTRSRGDGVIRAEGVSDAKHLMRDGLSHNSVSSVRSTIKTAAAIRYVVAKWLMELPHRPSSETSPSAPPRARVKGGS